MLVLYDYDTNAILVEPMKGKSAAVIIAAYTKALEVLTRRGHKPRLQKLDNEASTALLNFINRQASVGKRYGHFVQSMSYRYNTYSED